MTPRPAVFVGIDVGASRTKTAVIDENRNIIGHCVVKSGTDFTIASNNCLEASLEMAGVSYGDIVRAASTGYGRKNVSVADFSRTEISCHGKGCHYYFPEALTIIDIGGQDNKIIKLNDAGRRVSFKMNRKCAAGTGAFLEEMSPRLDIPLEEMNQLAVQSRNMVTLGSFCTVFSATEVLEKIRAGKKVADIVKGLFFSVVKRVLEMDALTDKIVMTGGVVAHNRHIVDMVAEITGEDIFVPEFPQLTGAIGAALYAAEL
jgi:predicted CoA-substrate-specific enzyme activase